MSSSASRFITAIASDSLVTFQTYDDSPRKRGTLSSVRHGPLDVHRDELVALNEGGAAVCLMVNRGDGRGRSASSVVEVRAVFVDLDGAPLQPVLDGPLKPHAVVESSPSKYHAYWFVQGVSVADFSPLQAALAARFGGDAKVKDLARVMRLPGFLHQKGRAFESQLLSLEEHPRFTRSHLMEALTIDLQEAIPTDLPKAGLLVDIAEGERNDTLFRLARSFVNKGLPPDQIGARIQRVNEDRCRPPLSAEEVEALVVSACSRPAKGSLSLPVVIFDCDAFRGLSHAARTVVCVAYRRYNGSNNGNIALPFEEFRKEFSRTQTFYRARQEAVDAGVLRVSRKRRYHNRGGREPDLFEVAMEPPSVPIVERSAVN